MRDILDKLAEYGADTAGAMRRFLENEDLYKVCCREFIQDENFERLEEAFSREEYGEMFEYAHAIKGVSGNLGLTPLYESVCNMVDSLRNDDYSNIHDLHDDVFCQYDKLKSLQL